ncbi:MAG TPA: extracellular solute-binding protein [Chloroflexota bacterium]
MGGTLYSADMKTSLIDQPESVAALQFMADIVNKQQVAPPSGAIKQPGDPWLNQIVATTWAHHGEEFSYQDQKESFPYDQVYYPQGSQLVISGGTTGFAIPTQSKQKDTAWTLTTFMTGEEQQKVIVGQHRWGSGLRSAVPLQYAPGYNTPNYVACHVDPLTGKGPQAVAAPSPPALTQIEQIWGTLLGPVWKGKQQAKDVAPTLKQQIDQFLQQPTQI